MGDARSCPHPWSPGELCFVWLPLSDLPVQVLLRPAGGMVGPAGVRRMLGDLGLSVVAAVRDEQRYVLSCRGTVWCLWFNEIERV